MPRSSARQLIGPGLIALAMLAVLLGLGTWQLRRLAWKDALLAEIARGEQGAAVPLPDHPEPFTKVQVTGRYGPDAWAFYATQVRDMPAGSTLGAQLIQPLQRPGGDPVLVDRGWVPLDRPPPVAAGNAAVVGYVRAPEPRSGLTPRADLPGRHFYALDPAEIGQALGLARVAPYTLVALGAVPFGTVPMPAEHLPQPPNNHLGYAVTWYSFALILAVTYVLWARKVLNA